MPKVKAPLRTSQAGLRDRSGLTDSWVIESESDGDYECASSQSDTAQDFNEAQHPSKNRLRKHASEVQPESQRFSPTSKKDIVQTELLMPTLEDTRGLRPRKTEKKPSSSKRHIPSPVGKSYKSGRAFDNSTPQDTIEQVFENVGMLIQSIFRWTYDILAKTLRLLKTPISYAIAGYICLGLIILLRNILTSSVYSALSPVCRIPGSSFLRLPMCKPPTTMNYKGEEVPPVHFDQLMNVQSKFEEVLEQSAGGVSLPLDMKRGEASIRDLRQVVRFSNLPSKNELVLEFDGFVETARMASYDLQKFNSHVGRAVDSVLATARWTQRVLNDIGTRDRSRGAIASFYHDTLLAPFQPLKLTEAKLLDQYISHTHVIEEEINRLIDEAQALLIILQNLEDRLDVIHGITIRDNQHAQFSKDEVLSQLWTILGGNRSKLGKFNSQLKLLLQVGMYRQTAFAHVAGTLVRLQAMGSELEELRERVGGAELLRDKADIPLSVHIENIQLGVERLELGRGRTKNLEEANLRNRLEGVKQGDAGRYIDSR